MNDGGLGDATGPTKETVASSKDLRVTTAGIWAIVGAVLVVVGVVLLVPGIGAIGVLVLVSAFFVNRANRTDSRVRDEFFRRGSR